MKKVFCLFLIVLTASLMTPGITAGATPPERPPARYSNNTIVSMQIGCPMAFQNGKTYHIDDGNIEITPMKRSGRTMLPLRFCGEYAVGGKVKYISDNDYITVTADKRVAKFKLNSRQLLITDTKGNLLKKITLDVAPVKVNGRVFIPARAISEGLSRLVVYKKQGSREFVFISKNSMTAAQRSEEISIFPLKHVDRSGTVKMWVPVGWTLDQSTAEKTTFRHYTGYRIEYKRISVSSSKTKVNRTKSEWETVLKTKIRDFKRTTINGKDAVTFNYALHDTYSDRAKCVLTSDNAGIEFTLYHGFTDLPVYPEFISLYQSVSYLK